MALATRPVGRTGLTVTTLGLGGAPLGGFRLSVSERQGVDTLLAAYAGGVRYFDTAPYYGYGRSEHIYGQALRTLDRDSCSPARSAAGCRRRLTMKMCRAGAMVVFRSCRPSTTAAKERCARWSNRCSG